MAPAIRAFFQSELYKSFWIFSIKSALVVGLSASVSLVLLLLMLGGSDAEIGPPLIAFAIGAAYGLVSGMVGFWTLFALLKLIGARHFGRVAVLVGALMAVLVLSQFSWSGWNLEITTQALVFPLAAVLPSLFCFVKLSEKHVRPFV